MVVLKASHVVQSPSRLRPTPVRSLGVGRVRGLAAGPSWASMLLGLAGHSHEADCSSPRGSLVRRTHWPLRHPPWSGIAHGSPCPGGRGTPYSRPVVSLRGYSALLEYTWRCHSTHYSAFAASFLLVSTDFSMASCSQSAVVPNMFLLPLQTLQPPLPPCSLPAGGSTWMPSSGLLFFWFSVGFSQWEAQHETGRREESGVGYLFPCLSP